MKSRPAIKLRVGLAWGSLLGDWLCIGWLVVSSGFKTVKKEILLLLLLLLLFLFYD